MRPTYKPLLWKQGAVFLLLLTFVGCSDSSGEILGPPTSSVPTVLATTPLDGAINVPITGTFSVTFSESMNATTLNGTTFTVMSAGLPVAGTVTYANATAVFTPAAPLANNKAYSATVTTGAKSAAGIPLAANRAWGFTTVAATPTVPTVISTLPLNGATGVASDGTFSAIFSEAMDPATLTAATFKVTAGPGATPVAGTVTYANLKAVFVPAAPLASNTAYTATVTTGAKSAAGVPLAANRAWGCTTVVMMATTPMITGLTPLDGATSVAANATFSATFSEAMDPATLTANTFKVTTGTAATPVAGTVTYANLKAVFVPNAPLAANSTFTAMVTTGAHSVSGVALAANRVWSFTSTGSQATTPLVLSNLPLAGAIGVPLNATLSATFSEAMDPATLTVNTFKVTSGSPALPVLGTVTYANQKAVFVPTAPLASLTVLTATVTTGAKSGAGVGLGLDHVWSFTSGTTTQSVPTVTATTPLDGATGVDRNSSLNATFSEAMDPATLNANTFTVTSGMPAMPVQGTVLYNNGVAEFLPAVQLMANTAYTATVSNAAKTPAGSALAQNKVWSFTTGSTMLNTLPVNLGTAGNYVILAKTGISTVPPSAVTGDIAVSPAAATYITGFGLTADATNVFSSSPQVTGQIFAANYAAPTPSNLTTAVSDMLLAFTDAAGRAPDVLELGGGNIGGMTLQPGVYKFGSSVLIPANLTLNGNATAVFIFEIAGDLTLASATNVFLTGGAKAKNIFWQVSGTVDLGTTAHLEGVVLSQTGITLRTGASVNGRLLAQTAVNIDSSTVVKPAP